MSTINQIDLFGRCKTTAEKLYRDSSGEFLKLWAEPEAWPICYILFAYHQNLMMCDGLNDADVIVEIYETDDDAPRHMGTKETVVYLALFKPDEGTMPWLSN